jgi:hypothetical protein
MLSLSSIHIGLHALHTITSVSYFRIWVQTWLVMISHVVMSIVQVFPSFIIVSLAYIFVRDGLSSVVIWFDRGANRCCGLSKVGMVETIGFRQVMGSVVLESAKDWILGVDTPVQHMSPRVRYETICLLIRYAISYVSCSVEWKCHHTLRSYFITYFVISLNHMMQQGTFVRKTLALHAGTVYSKNCRKAWHTPVVDFCNSI